MFENRRITSVNGAISKDVGFVKDADVSAQLIRRTMSDKDISKSDFNKLKANVVGGSEEVIKTLFSLSPESDFKLIVQNLNAVGALSHEDKSLISSCLEQSMHEILHEDISYESLGIPFTKYKHEEEFFHIAQCIGMEMEDTHMFLQHCLLNDIDPIEELTKPPSPDPDTALQFHSMTSLSQSTSLSDDIPPPVGSISGGGLFAHMMQASRALNPSSENVTNVNIDECVDFAIRRVLAGAEKGRPVSFSSVFKGTIGEFAVGNMLEKNSEALGIQKVLPPRLDILEFGDGGVDIKVEKGGNTKSVQVKTSQNDQCTLKYSEQQGNNLFCLVSMKSPNQRQIEDLAKANGFDTTSRNIDGFKEGLRSLGGIKVVIFIQTQQNIQAKDKQSFNTRDFYSDFAFFSTKSVVQRW